jgi:hypothetical protein
MTEQLWSWLLAVVGVLGIYFVGRKTIWGWLVLFINECLWIAYALVTKQYGFIFAALAYMAVYLRSYRAWRTDGDEVQEEIPNSPFDASERISLTVRKVYFVGEFSHWEGEIVYKDSHAEALYCEVTGPTSLGVLDKLGEYLVDTDSAIDKDWLDESAT